MILCDSEILAAIKFGQISIEPPPPPDCFTTTAVDLHLGKSDFKRWRAPSGPGVEFCVDASHPQFYRNVSQYLEDVATESDGSVIIAPNEFLLALTSERLHMREESRIAARVEGKSSLARIGLGVHITAPTIHSGFEGYITLEIKNHGNMPIKLRPGMRICQLIFETVFGTPSKMMTGMFQNQDSVGGAS